MEQNLIVIDVPELKAIEVSKADQIRATFSAMANMLSEFEASYNEIVAEAAKGITTDVCKKARELRLKYVKVRTAVEKTRKDQKAEYVIAGKAIDGVSNIYKAASVGNEAKLQEIEDYAEIQEQKRLEAIRVQRVEELSKYVEDTSGYELAGMKDDVWLAFLAAKKQQYEDRIAAEKKAEEDRIEAERLNKLRIEREGQLKNFWQFVPKDHPSLETLSNDEWDNFLIDVTTAKANYDDEQARIKAENERLKKEAEEKERLAKIEADKRAKAEADRIAKETAERKAREAKEAEDKRIRDEQARKEREANEKKLQAERAERDRIQKELDAKKAAELKAKEDAEKAEQAKLRMGDSEKALSLIADIKELTTKYSFKSKAYVEMYSRFGEYILKVINSIKALKTK